jgi:hypothetical protein
MGEQIIKQPDGKLAVFSSMVDGFIVTDATPEELIEWRAERAAEDSRRTTRIQIEQVLSGKPRPYGSFTLTWETAVRRAMEGTQEEGDEEG